MVRLWTIAVATAIGLPLGLMAYLATPPASDLRLDDAVQHFAVTTNVSLLAAAVSIAVMRPALETRDWRSVLVALGFMTLGGFFLVHGLATPGVLLRGGSREIAAVSVLALAGQLAMTLPAVLFAARYTPVLGRLRRSRSVTPRRLLGATALVIVAFAVDALWQPAGMSDMVESMTGYGAAASYAVTSGSLQASPSWVAVVAGTTIVLLAFAAVQQAREYSRSRLPSHAALVMSFILLAQAQVSAILGPPYSLLFWNYHALLAAATVIAIGALFLELDRRRGLERFLPPTVVERIVTGDRLSLEGERRTATILFSDLRGSTALAERVTPEAAVATVNAYLRAMARAVIDEGGILDKFTGDGLMAIFGAMSDPTSGAAAAARAALRMRADIAAINAERQARDEPTIGYGVGINTGDVVLGAIGLPERSDYTAMGDAVNTAARMESLTKELGADIVISHVTAAHLDGAAKVRHLGEATVKGKSAPVQVFALDPA
ncbi:MAG: adenylate/guanylate cyclase domain-containing protein [Chloroflexi bacterium]|nr:adenylate/guanylate cyclase domain-containing protein [Chloroflexota bacterium]